jgi:3-hydroxybutyryl-CoA dehydratase
MDDVRNFRDETVGYCIEDMTVGMTARYARTVTEADIVLFAGVSGDHNPIHMNEVYAASTMFKGRIAHGFLSASLISTTIGNRLPGPGAIYLSQNLRFLAPVRVGDTVEARVTVTEVFPEKKRVALKTICFVGERQVVDGDALVMVPTRG